MTTSVRQIHRRALALEDSIRPGSSIVYDLRRTRPALERMARSELRSAFKEAGERVAATSAYMGGIMLSEADEDNPYSDERIKSIIQNSRLDVWKLQRLKPILERAWSRSAQQTEQALAKHGIYGPVRKKISEGLREQGAHRMRLVNMDEGTEAAMKQVIKSAKELGVSTRDIGRLIEHYVPGGKFTKAGSGYRSRMIAQTETLESARWGELAVYEASPVVEKVIAFDGTESDEECRQRNGEIFTIEEARAENGNTHPWCVLTWAPA